MQLIVHFDTLLRLNTLAATLKSSCDHFSEEFTLSRISIKCSYSAMLYYSIAESETLHMPNGSASSTGIRETYLI